MRSTPPVLAVFAALALGACASNPYRSTYTPQIHAKVPKGEPVQFQPAASPPRLLSTSTIKADAVRLLEQGYWPVGSSKFTGQYVQPKQALEQAQLIGAEVVVVAQKHVGSSTVSVPVMDWTPDRRVVVQDSAQIHDSETGKVQTVTHESVTTIEGERYTRYEPQTVETYDHRASYWKKAVAPVLGILGSDLEEAERKAQQSNKGVLVKVVVRRSPAFIADVMRGDIVRKLAGQEVLGTDDFFDAVMANAGKTVELVLWREGKLVKKSVELGKR